MLLRCQVGVLYVAVLSSMCAVCCCVVKLLYCMLPCCQVGILYVAVLSCPCTSRVVRVM